MPLPLSNAILKQHQVLFRNQRSEHVQGCLFLSQKHLPGAFAACEQINPPGRGEKTTSSCIGLCREEVGRQLCYPTTRVLYSVKKERLLPGIATRCAFQVRS